MGPNLRTLKDQETGEGSLDPGVRRLQRESETSPFVFVSERGSPFTTACSPRPALPG